MIKKYVYGNPIETGAVICSMETENNLPEYGEISFENGFSFHYQMDEDMILYGLGESNRGINKRGFLYVSDASDDPNHTEDKHSLYGVHNFLIFDGKEQFAIFIDYPAFAVFDLGYTKLDTCEITVESADLVLYVITGENLKDIVKQFRQMIGKSYIPPKFAFGYGQSRWGYRTKEDFVNVVKGYRENQIPIDMLYLDIDYMDHYKDFTVNQEEFPDFPAFVEEMQKEQIHLVPIIDAGVKIEKGYSVYEEGGSKGYFCKDQDGKPFAVAVWPGYTHLPDVSNKEARAWFGNQYQVLLDAGVEGFWNDMNEPAMFHTPAGMEACKKVLTEFADSKDDGRPIWQVSDAVGKLANDHEDYKRMYHNLDGKIVSHDQVHNLYGYYMTLAASEAFDRIVPDKRILIFSRSSYVGMHRYGGVWQGDNKSWWSHILLNLKMMASLNMCGFLYNGADLGGFGADTTEDLMLRWLALGVFTPLMRNHAALGTREQEVYRFSKMEDMKHVICVRYCLIPYLYSEFVKASLMDQMYARPLGFDFEEDEIARHIEDQLLIGNEIMIAPVYTQNAIGRNVYLPEDMIFVKFAKDGIVTQELKAGHHFVKVALNEVPLFIRNGKCIPIAQPAKCVEEIDTKNLSLLGYEDAEYVLYDDDGYTKHFDAENHFKKLK